MIVVECTTELTSWGPAIPGKSKVGDGSTYRWWLKQLVNLGYRYRVLYLNSMFFGVPQSRDRLYIAFWDRRLPTPDLDHPIVLAFNAGDRGRSMESSSPEDLMTSALPIARQLFGDDISPVEVRTSNWTIDPYARAYSFHAPGSGLDDRRRLQEPIGDRLYLAGEAVGVNNPATVTGAAVSGRYAAGQLMHRLSG
jgi:site-specific DNA-cytosine methylase